jgi:flagellar biosynthesis protein FlhG
MDQAEKLRKHLQKITNSSAKTIAVLSGKGGVGKSNVSLNLAIGLINRQKHVLLFDLDIGYGNIDILIGQTSHFSIVDFFENNKPIDDVINNGPNGLDYISGGTGLSYLFRMKQEQFDDFSSQLEAVFERYDYIIFDMGAGMSFDSLKFVLSVDEMVVVTTPEPTSITDAYSAIKFISMHEQSIPISIIVNRAVSRKAAHMTFMRMQTAIEQFLSLKASFAGWIPDDRRVSEAVNRQVPFTLLFPKSDAAKAMQDIVQNYVTSREGMNPNHIIQTSFMKKMSHFFTKGRISNE